MHIGAPVGYLPAQRLHFFGIAAENSNLPAFGVQHRITAEKLFAHFFFHMHTDLIELRTHQAVTANRRKILPVHHAGRMMAGNAAPVSNSRSRMLIAAAVAAVGIALNMADHNRHIRVINIFIHNDRIAPAGRSQINQMVIILTVMIFNLSAEPKLIKQLPPQNTQNFFLGVLPMQAVRAKQQDILFFNAGRIKLLQNEFDCYLPVRGRLLPAFDPVRKHNHTFTAGLSQFR